MSALTNPKHERFAQEVAAGRTASDAYRTSFGKDNRRYASELGQRPDISGRIQDILSHRANDARQAAEKAAERLAVSVESLIAEAEEVRLAAMAAGQFAPAISAIKEKGILAGVRVEKREQTLRNIADLSDDELARIAFAGGEGAIAAASGASKPH